MNKKTTAETRNQHIARRRRVRHVEALAKTLYGLTDNARRIMAIEGYPDAHSWLSEALRITVGKQFTIIELYLGAQAIGLTHPGKIRRVWCDRVAEHLLRGSLCKPTFPSDTLE